MKVKNKALILFDLDGTLVDSVPDLAAAVNDMSKRLGRQTFDEETIRCWVGNGAQRLVERALSGSSEVDPDLDERLLKNASDYFFAYYEDHLCEYTRAYAKVPETVRALKEKGYLLAVVTNKPFAFAEPILEEMELAENFSLILGGDTLEKKKPDPLPLVYACKKLDIPIADTVMVGDSKNDIQAANACGMDVIAVTYGYNYGEDIGIYHPDITINSFAELLETIL